MIVISIPLPLGIELVISMGAIGSADITVNGIPITAGIDLATSLCAIERTARFASSAELWSASYMSSWISSERFRVGALAPLSPGVSLHMLAVV